MIENIPDVHKYKGTTKDHPLMVEAIKACDHQDFATALCDFLDGYVTASAADKLDAMRVLTGTLAEMKWVMK